MIEALFGNVTVALVVIVFFGVTIFVHELGHYLAARACGLVVEVFSIGFGPALWRRKIGGIVYKIGLLPFGGYVALPQLDPTGMSRIQGAEGSRLEELPRAAAWRKIVVSVAGAAGNVVLAVVLAFVVYWAGVPASTVNQDSVLGYVDPDGPAHAAGLRTGDRVEAVNGVAVRTWGELVQECSMNEGVSLRVRSPDGTERTVEAPTEEWEFGIKMIGGVESRGACVVGAVSAGMGAERAGIREGDVIVEFDGETVLSRGHLTDLVALRRDREVPVVVERKEGGEARRIPLAVTPQYDEAQKMTRIGIMFRQPAGAVDVETRVHPLPFDQLRHHASAIFRFLGNLVSPGKAGRAASLMGGPVAIVTHYVQIIRASLMLAVWFTGFLNVNLAILNLLPIPVLDGGHIVFSLWELVARRPVSARLANALVNVFAVLLIGLFVFLSVRDVDRFTPVGRMLRRMVGEAPAEEAAAPGAGAAAPAAVTNAP